MGWDIEFNQLYGHYQLVFDNSDKVYDLSADDYEQALDQAAAILDQLGYYTEA